MTLATEVSVGDKRIVFDSEGWNRAGGVQHDMHSFYRKATIIRVYFDHETGNAIADVQWSDTYQMSHGHFIKAMQIVSEEPTTSKGADGLFAAVIAIAFSCAVYWLVKAAMTIFVVGDGKL